ncbi:hypothetical protein SETIT_1G018300v2 [Setaria italica]|uniref:RING-type E3 ubiquitin transferase n=2 Tax=Setaria italica TaxID=4555 RepID=A0A368PG81_SETIT|nr:E3 ubiquitin-protein ligase EL5 [Setaria italica]RCV04659.1 hypothetical protein SETIT_1G018300v2 [Setaria italica]
MSESDEPDTCYRWSCNFIVAHAVLATGFVTAPVAVVHLLRRPHSGAATFFAMFAVFCATVSSILCCRFYADLNRPPWPRWFSATASGGQQQDDSGGGGGLESTRELSNDLRQPELPVMVRLEMQAALVTDRIPTYEHGDGAVDCAVCLGDVEKGETVRRLPACHHVFHRECVDQWLRAHATCPVCRSGVLPERPPEFLVSVEAVHVQPGLVIPARANIMLPGQQPGIGLWFGPASRLN